MAGRQKKKEEQAREPGKEQQKQCRITHVKRGEKPEKIKLWAIMSDQ